MDPDNKSDYSILRQMAEELLKTGSASKVPVESKDDLLKLIHEVQLHEIELKIQNEQLLQARDQASVNSEKYTQLFDFAPTSYFVLTKEGEIIDSNFSGRKLLGKEYQNLNNSRFGFFISDDSRPIFNNFLSKIFKNKGKESCIVSISIEDKLPVYGHMTGLVNEKSDYCLVNIIDISNLKLTEQTLENKIHELTIATNELTQSLQLNIAKDRLLTILGHDLRNQFTGLLGFSRLLTENFRHYNIAELEEISNHIAYTAQNAYSLLDEILIWAKKQSDRITFEPQKLRFIDICKDILEFLNPIATTKTIIINCNSKKDITVFADLEMLKTILRNLISNAIKFTNSNGEINISARENSRDVTISVSDNGTGISADTLEKLFNTSQFLTTEGTRREKGTGLGLMLCKEFVEKHGGKIWVESELEKGSVFSFTIPRKHHMKVKGSNKDNEIVTGMSNLKILIADDNKSIRMILEEMVSKYSTEILFAKNGNEAVNMFRLHPEIDLILMDSDMPGMKGPEAVKLIRQVNSKVTIIISTADDLAKVTEEYAGLSINDYLPKPYSRNYLNQLIIKHFPVRIPK